MRRIKLLLFYFSFFKKTLDKRKDKLYNIVYDFGAQPKLCPNDEKRCDPQRREVYGEA